MAPTRRTPTTLLHILLLLSLHAGPVAAARRAEAETRQASDSGLDSEMLSRLFRSEREEMEALSGEGAERFCGFGYSKTMRYFHFELDVAGEEQNGVRHFAAELIRAPRAPRLVLHAGRTWSVRMTDDPSYPVDWVLTPLPGAGDASYSVQVDLLYEVRYIRRAGLNGIQIMFSNGTSLQFSGGLYYPEAVVAAALRRNRGSYYFYPGEERAAAMTAGGEARPGADGVQEGANVLGVAVAKHVGRFGTQGAVGGVALGFGLSAGFSSAIVLMNAILNGFLNFVGAAAFVTIDVGVPALTAVQILSFTSTAGGLGLAGGVAVGLGLGLVLGIPAGAATFISHWIKQRRELRISASEKIFAKLSCHHHFKRCDWSGKILVPESHKCPP